MADRWASPHTDADAEWMPDLNIETHRLQSVGLNSPPFELYFGMGRKESAPTF
jgi:hypothetical protein